MTSVAYCGIPAISMENLFFMFELEAATYEKKK